MENPRLNAIMQDWNYVDAMLSLLETAGRSDISDIVRADVLRVFNNDFGGIRERCTRIVESYFECYQPLVPQRCIVCAQYILRRRPYYFESKDVAELLKYRG